MSLKETIQADMKTALKAGEKDRLGVIRMAFAAIRQVEIDSRKDIDDAGSLAVIEKLVKQRKESARQYRDAKRPELAEKEEAEIELLSAYLPAQLSADEVSAMIDEIIATTGASSIKDMGKVMGQLKARAQGRVDMSAAGAIVRSKIT
ncbi:MAG: GatB/YqeY domain-containing protein [Gammaproteobacteria bacterium]|nr:GatB/YqeY domain-containing protein [Gammaproteobacteria bacterium]